MQRLDKKQIKKLVRKKVSRHREIYLVLENVQYARNVAGLFRTADAAGVRKVILSGISKQPPFGKDLVKASRHKEKVVAWEYSEDLGSTLNQLKKQGFVIIAIELAEESFPVAELSDKIKSYDKVCFVAGNEVYGVVNKTLEVCDLAVHIPMYGKGASMNVATSVGIVLYSF